MEQQTLNTALLVMDMQDGILPRVPNAQAVIENVSKAIAKAREHNVLVIYVVVGFRQGAPEVSENSSKTFAAGKAHFANMDMAAFMKVQDALAPAANEVTVAKRRVSAFTGSDLEVILRSYGTKHLVLTGVATSGVVLSTLREAADKDFQITVLADCCQDSEQDVHQILITKVFPKQADVLNVDEWLVK